MMKARPFLYLILIIGIAFPLQLSAQNSGTTISGKVTDLETGEPLPGVNVYLSETSIGASTDERGRYSFTTYRSGAHKLVFSMIGYKPRIRTLELDDSPTFRYSVSLKPHVTEMGEVEVVASNEQWRRDFNFFRRQFLGRTKFSEETEIKNPWVIDFKINDRGFFTAQTDQPIIVENRALGYKLHIELVEFVWLQENDKQGVYRIHPRYEEMTPSSQEEKEKWIKNRAEAYFGSLQHFLKHLYSDDLENNNYSIRPSRKLYKMTKGETKFELMVNKDIPMGMLEEVKAFKTNSKIKVRYSRRVLLDSGNNMLDVLIKKHSEFEAITPKEIFYIHKNHHLMDPTSLLLFGDWSESRIANTLPDDYVPPIAGS